MNRKAAALVASLLGIAAVAGVSSARDDGEKSPLHKAMEKVNKTNGAIKKAVQNEVNYNKADKKKLQDDCELLVKLGKESKDYTEGVKKHNKSIDAWNKASDDFIEASDKLAKLVAKKDAKQAEAKKAHQAIGATCAACHKEFKTDDE